jgi:hypothetical protein
LCHITHAHFAESSVTRNQHRLMGENLPARANVTFVCSAVFRSVRNRSLLHVVSHLTTFHQFHSGGLRQCRVCRACLEGREFFSPDVRTLPSHVAKSRKLRADSRHETVFCDSLSIVSCSQSTTGSTDRNFRGPLIAFKLADDIPKSLLLPRHITCCNVAETPLCSHFCRKFVDASFPLS